MSTCPIRSLASGLWQTNIHILERALVCSVVQVLKRARVVHPVRCRVPVYMKGILMPKTTDTPVCPQCKCHCDIIHTATVYNGDTAIHNMVIMIINPDGQTLYDNENAESYEQDNLFAFCSNCGQERTLDFQYLLHNR